MKNLNILSLFDGCSGGQQAITNLGIKDYNYFSSEIDKYAIQVTKDNYPNTIHIGDVTKISFDKFYQLNFGNNDEWIEAGKIDLLLGGSPCQGFSFAGKQLNFEDPRSALFFEYVRILKEVKPKYFLLENVRMKKEYQDVISEHLFGIQPTIINSSLLVAQNRVRLYWVGELQEDGTYKKVEISQPKDRGILLKDILEEVVDEKFYLTEKNLAHLQREFGSKGKEQTIDGVCACLTASMGTGGGNVPYIQQLNNPNHSINRIYGIYGKSPTLNTMQGGNRQPKVFGENIFRKLTPLECERLQGVKDNFTASVSHSQRYKMLGNGWTIPVIEHILKQLGLNTK